MLKLQLERLAVKSGLIVLNVTMPLQTIQSFQIQLRSWWLVRSVKRSFEKTWRILRRPTNTAPIATITTTLKQRHLSRRVDSLSSSTWRRDMSINWWRMTGRRTELQSWWNSMIKMMTFKSLIWAHFQINFRYKWDSEIEACPILQIRQRFQVSRFIVVLLGWVYCCGCRALREHELL